MLTEHSVEEAARAAGLDAPARFVATTGSTNTDLLALAAEGAPAWTVLVAGQQVAGRGRLGRTWISQPGVSLLVSVLLRPRFEAGDAPIVSLAAAVAMTVAARRECGVAARCKWPNDITVRDRKLGGILTEATIHDATVSHAVVGAGVNVLQRREDFPPSLREIATSVALEGGRAEPRPLLRTYLEHLRGLVETLESGQVRDVLDEYRGVCDTLGRHVRATTPAGRTVEGEAETIGDRGALIVRQDGRREVVGFGEVEHLR